MNKLMKIRKSKKGFTLVELLVVLVIIAILMAAIIPSMLGFIDKAKEETAMAECRNTYTSSMVIMNELYGNNKFKTGTSYAFTDDDLKKVNDMADTTTIGGSVTGVTVTIVSGRPYISGIIYNSSTKFVYTGTATAATEKLVWVKGAAVTKS